MPFFSILISVYNRPQQIARCLQSCCGQDFSDLEVIVVDDGSTDDTVQVVERIRDGRIRLLKHQENMGMSAALRTATSQARGQWVVRIDSDHALLPGALSFFHAHVINLSADIGVLGARYQWDNGRITPRFIPSQAIDYEGRIRWVEEEGGSDYISCIRRDILDRVQWRERRGSTTALFQYELAHCTNALIFDDVLALEYTDALNSFHRADRKSKLHNRIINAPDQAQTYDEILEKHGQALMRCGPNQYAFYHLMSGFNHFLAGHRRKGYLRLFQYLRRCPWSLTGWGVLISGLLSRRLLSFLYLFRT